MEFREMKKPEKSLPAETLEEIIKNAQYSVVSMIGDDGYPYGVALNMAYIDGALYCHGSANGKKIDSLRKNPQVCVTTSVDVIVDAPNHNTYYKSAMCFGKAIVLEGDELLLAGEKYGEYYGLDAKMVKAMLARGGEKEVAFVKILIEHVSIRVNNPKK